VKKIAQINYDYCKGCGVCANECPQDAISMIPEIEARGETE
jgi:pyruvate ferredoxin oxidoreductase delta subunit